MKNFIAEYNDELVYEESERLIGEHNRLNDTSRDDSMIEGLAYVEACNRVRANCAADVLDLMRVADKADAGVWLFDCEPTTKHKPSNTLVKASWRDGKLGATDLLDAISPKQLGYSVTVKVIKNDEGKTVLSCWVSRHGVPSEECFRATPEAN